MGAQLDVIVIGGGIIGCACALRLAQRGRRVTLLERAASGKAASWASAGIVDSGSPLRTDPLAELRRASFALWPEFAAELREKTGMDPELRIDGGLDLITDDNQAAAAERECAAWSVRETSPVRRLTADELQAVEPALAPCARGALLDSQMGHVRAPRLMRALVAACQAGGVRMEENCAADEFESNGATITAIRAGSRVFPAGIFLLASGAWSASIGQRLADQIRVHPVRGQMLAFASSAPQLRRIVQVGRRYLVPRADGLVLAGSTEEPDAGFEVATTLKGMQALEKFARDLLPGLGPIAHSWAGLRPASVDGKPYLGQLPGISNFFVATGHFRSGVVLAPITAELLARAIDGDGDAVTTLLPFSPGRRL